MCDVVVGIDFGSYGTGYAYSFNNPDDILIGTFPNQGVDNKVPTEIILDKNLEILAFGHKCKKYIDENKLVNGELYFQRIKMNLYENKNTIQPQNESSSYSLDIIISKVLIYVKTEAIKSIKANRPNIDNKKIRWVVTVPAIWNETQKGIMIKASEKAQLFNEYTKIMNFFALEPEAASLYCCHDDAIDQSLIKAGKTFIICDLGGGTGDIVTHTKNNENKINEKYPPIGGNYGSNEIDKMIFDRIIAKIFDVSNFNSLKEKNIEQGNILEEDLLYSDWADLQEEIEKKKKITKDSKGKETLLKCDLFQDFTNNKSLEELVNNYNKNCQKGWDISIRKKDKWILSFPNQIFFDLIKEHSEKISEKINEIYQNVEDIESIIYVGGYCKNEIIFNNIKREFRHLNHLKPSYPELAVVKGAVLFGLSPEIINIRKAKYSVGIEASNIWDEKTYGKIGKKKYYEEENNYYCEGCFFQFFEIGQNISIDDTIEQSFSMRNSKSCDLIFYKSLKKKPILCYEEGVEFMGKDILELEKDYSKDEREIKVILKFGGTYVEGKCIHLKSGKETVFNLYFNK